MMTAPAMMYIVACVLTEAYIATHRRPFFLSHGKRVALQQIEAIGRIICVTIGVCGEVVTSYNRELSHTRVCIIISVSERWGAEARRDRYVD